MALVPLNQYHYFPKWPDGIYSLNTSLASTTLNHADDRVAVIVRMPVAGDIAKVHFRTGFVSGAQTLQVSLQNVSSGAPDLTVDQYRDVSLLDTDDETAFSTGLITDTGADGGTKRTVSVGDLVAIVFRLPSYSSGSASISQLSATSGDNRLSKIVFSNSGGAFTVQNANPIIAIEMADGSFPAINNSAIMSSIATSSVWDGATPDEYALRLQAPASMRAVGVYIKGGSVDIAARLYNDAGSLLGGPSTNWELNISQASMKDYYFSTPVTLTKDAWYRISWLPTTGSSRFLNVHALASANHRSVYGFGPNFMLSTRTDAGSWSEDTTKYIVAGFIVDQVDDGAGGGGGGGCSLSNGTAVIPPTCT